MNDLKCKIHGTHLEYLGGCSAHPDNWYCPECEKKTMTTQNKIDKIELAKGILQELNEIPVERGVSPFEEKVIELCERVIDEHAENLCGKYKESLTPSDEFVRQKEVYSLADIEQARQEQREDVRRRTDDGHLAECPLCGSLDIGGAHDTVNCYGCGLQITKPKPLQNAIDAWNRRNGKSLPQPPMTEG